MIGSAGRGITLFRFESSTLVLWAEEVAMEAGIPVEVVPAPAADSEEGRSGFCGLALQTFSTSAAEIEAILRSKGIPFRREA